MITHRSHFFRVIVPQQVFAVAAIGLLFYNQSLWWLAATFAAWFLCYVVGEGIFLHRYFSHQAFETHPWIAKTFAVFALLSGFGSPISYRATHIGLHHAHADQPGDSHSPIHGFWHSWILWHLKSQSVPLMISKKLMRDPFYVWLETNIVKIWWTSVILLALIDWRLPLYTLGLAGAIGIHMAGATNCLTHRFGTRRFDTRDNSKNIALMSWFTWQGSGGLHNNHHARPSRYHDSHAWYEFDIAKWLVPLIATKINYDIRK
jgi:stearoyl-CoA desaturase (delta-9 desaturase)